MPERRLLTIVIPAYNEEANLPILWTRLLHALEECPDLDYEFLFVDNASQDDTGAVIRRLAAEDPRVRWLRFSRNMGLETSLAAGVEYARGDAMVFLLSDLQDPPELVPELVARWREGHDVVYGLLTRRGDGNFFKTLGARVAYWLIYRLSDVHIPPNATDYRLISRPVIEALRRCGERNRYMRGLVHWVGFRQVAVPYQRHDRAHGASSANLIFCIQFAFHALFAFSTTPLQLASLVGLAATLLSLLAAVVYVALLFLSSWGWVSLVPPPAGWTTQVVLLLFFSGVQCLFLGILGAYIAHVYREVKARPLWMLSETGGFPREHDPLAGPR